MSKYHLTSKASTTGLGLDLRPGDDHYRAYVGPPTDYDLISAMVFNLLTCLGLRQHHRVLDIGCGSLRIGRLLIPYLNPKHYFGIEPNKWLVDDGIINEVGKDLVAIKEPNFSFETSLEEFKSSLGLDFAFAQSIFSHCGLDLISEWLSQVAYHLKDDGVFLATFIVDAKDYDKTGWVYPGCVSYKSETIAGIASSVGLDFTILDWAHPRQTWALFSKEKYDKTMIKKGPITWNNVMDNATHGKGT